MGGKRRIAGVVLALCAIAPASVIAQDAPPESATDAEARGLFQAGTAALDDGRSQEAYDYFLRSHELSGRAALLYNMGIAADRSRMDAEALDAFERFLAAEPETERRAEVEGRIATLRATLTRGSDGSAEDDSATSAGPPLAPVAVAAAGGAALIAGGVLFGLGLSANGTVEDAARGTSWPEVSDDYDRGKTFTLLGGVAAGVGLAAVAAGIVWLASGSGEDEGDTAATVSLGPAGALVRGRF
jgi:tetratricopeptide (TPR) repeat protein